MQWYFLNELKSIFCKRQNDSKSCLDISKLKRNQDQASYYVARPRPRRSMSRLLGMWKQTYINILKNKTFISLVHCSPILQFIR